MNIKEVCSKIDEETNDLIAICPHCGTKVHIERLWQDYHSFSNRDEEFYITFRCKSCKKLILKTFLFKQNPYSNHEDLEPEGWNEKFSMSLDDDDELSEEEKEFIPKQVISNFQEALKCKSIGANRTSSSMFRRALQSSIVILGANHKQDLIKQINSLTNLPNDIKDWAHQIRIFGNWGAHPDKDKLKEVDHNDVEEVYDFISKFFMYMFIMPEKVKRSRKKRDEKTKKYNEIITTD
jgi:hypothetical protein